MLYLYFPPSFHTYVVCIHLPDAIYCSCWETHRAPPITSITNPMLLIPNTSSQRHDYFMHRHTANYELVHCLLLTSRIQMSIRQPGTTSDQHNLNKFSYELWIAICMFLSVARSTIKHALSPLLFGLVPGLHVQRVPHLPIFQIFKVFVMHSVNSLF